MPTRPGPPTHLEVYRVLHPSADTWLLHFAYEKNPLPMNGSRGRSPYPKAKWTRAIREQTHQLARTFAKIPPLGRCKVQLTQWVTVNRRRDLDNFAQLEKPMYDGLVDAGIVTDDTPDLMTKLRPLVVHVDRSEGLVTRPGFTLRIQKLDTEDGD